MITYSLPTRLRADTRPTGKGVCIAMIDSDFVQHPDLVEPINRIAGYYDAVHDKMHSLPPDSEVKARHWHGTMTACTASGNGFLSQGVYSSLAPESTVFLVRTMNDKGKVTTEVLTRALKCIKDNAKEFGISIVNISVYADEEDQTVAHPVNKLVEELVAKGIVVICAVGNNPNVTIRPPAAAPGCLAVGGSNDKNTMVEDDDEMYHSTFGITSMGFQKPEVIAPAIFLPAPILLNTPQSAEAAALSAMDAMNDEMLLATAPSLMKYTKIALPIWTSRSIAELRSAVEKRMNAELVVNKHYKLVDGTSFASPIVASIAAQIREVDPHITPADVKRLLMTTARPIPGVSPLAQGAGVVQQREAISRVKILRRDTTSN